MIEDKDAVIPTFASRLDDVFSFSQLNNDSQAIHDLIKENILANDNLHTSIDLLNSALVSHANSSYGLKSFIPIISVIIGALLGYFFNRSHWSWTEKKKKETESFTKLFTLISELETLSVDYWTKDHNEDDEKNEVYIKSKIRLLTKYTRAINTKDKSIKNEIDNFVSDIFDLVTGGDFESKNRKASKTTAISISYKCADINANVSSYC
jgi:hypothetical protein